MKGFLQILLITPELATAETFRSVLEQRGHLISHVQNLQEARYAGRFDVLIHDLDVQDEAPSDDVFAFLNERNQLGLNSRAVVLTARPTAEVFKRALLSGNAQILLKPVALDRLVALVEDRESGDPAGLNSQTPATEAAHQDNPFEFQKHYSLERGMMERCARDLCGYAMRIGVGPSGRARIASAVSEILDNSRRHAYEYEGGRVLVTAFADAGKRVSIVVQDFGLGFALDEDRDAFGLARASALAEGLRIDSSVGSGTRVELEFEVWPVRFEGEEIIDLSELDWLPPALTHKVLSRLEKGESPFRLSPALAVTVGRLLAAQKRNTPSLHSELADGSLRSRHGA